MNELKDQFSYYMNMLLNEKIQTTAYFDRIDDFRDMIYPFVEDDPYYPLIMVIQLMIL